MNRMRRAAELDLANATNHSHATPLHQAAGKGYEEVVRLLVKRGARTDLKDILWQGTPADWARHAGKPEIEALLRGEGREGKRKD